MSDYPSALFPSTTRDYNKDNQQKFTDYGCWESIDVEFTETDVSVFSRKNRARQLTADLHISNDVIDRRILVPIHDFLTIGNPTEIGALFDDNISYGDELCVKKSWDPKKSRPIKRGRSAQVVGSSHVLTLPVQQYVTNLIHDHPHICGETFDRLSHGVEKKQYEYSNKQQSLSMKNFKFIDYTLCDVGRKLLQNIVTDEAQNDLKKRYSDRDFTGGCLSYKSIKQRKNKQYGILVSAQGQCLDELCVKILNIDCNEKKDERYTNQFPRSDDDSYLFPNLQFGPEIRQTLNGRICQIDVGEYESSDDIMIGTRSDYHVLFNKFSKSATDWNEQNYGDITTKKCLSCLGLLKTTGRSRVSNIAINPFIPGECVVATEDSCVRLWIPEIDKNCDGSLKNLGILLDSARGDLSSDHSWRQVCFAAHPKQLFIADGQNISIFDIRTQNSNMSLLNMLTSRHAKQSEKIYCIENCSNIGNEYGCLVATNYNLFLMDQRFCGEPLLQWGTNMSFPPHYIRTTSIANIERQHDFSQSPSWSYATSAVIIGNQYSQEIYSYQMCRTMKHSTIPKHYAPQAVGPPRISGSFRDLRQYLTSVSTKHSEYLENRSSKMAIGIEAISISNESTSGMLGLQINSVGDIGYQTWCLKNVDEAYDMTNLITGKTSETFRTDREERKRACLNEIKKRNYDAWIKKVTMTQHCDDINTTENVCISNRVCPQHTNEKISSSRPLFDLPSTDCCSLCLSHQTSSNQLGDTSSCQRCDSNVERVTNILDKLKLRSVITLSTLEPDNHHESINDTDIDSNKTPLNLIQLDGSGDDYDNELGRLLKATWTTSYEEYWKTLQNVNERRKEDEKLEQIRQTFDLGQTTELNETQVEKRKRKPKRVVVTKEKKNDASLPSLKRKRNSEQNNDFLPATSFLSWLTPTRESTWNMITHTNPSPIAHNLLPLPDASILNNTKNPVNSGTSGSPAVSIVSNLSPWKSTQDSFAFFSPRKLNSSSHNINFGSPRRSFLQHHSQTDNIATYKSTKRKSLSQHSVGF